MPEGRMVSRSISQSEQLGSVSLEADYLFGRCIPHLDRDGRMSGKPELVKAITCPLRAEIPQFAVAQFIHELVQVGLVRWYECEGKQVLEFPNFKKHQKGFKYDRESVSRYPGYDRRTCQDLVPSESGGGPELVRITSAHHPPKVS